MAMPSTKENSRHHDYAELKQQYTTPSCMQAAKAVLNLRGGGGIGGGGRGGKTEKEWGGGGILLRQT